MIEKPEAIGNAGGLHADSPILSPDHDTFGVDPFAQAIARSICETNARAGLVYAINGAWGSGKSSVINLVRHHLKTAIATGDIVIADFNPWWFSGTEALTLSFFEELKDTMGESIGDVAKEALANIGSRVSSVGPLLGGLASLISPLVGTVVGGAATAVGNLTRLDGTVEKEYRKVVDALNSQKRSKKFLIILDDIDRLTTDDALQIFKLLKSVGRLPNVIYLMAFDRQLADKMTAERFPAEGASYLDKIIQGGFDLPAPDNGDLSSQLLATLAEIMGELPQEKMQRFGNLFHDGVAPLLKTPRDVVRLGNSLRVSWPAIGSDVDRADYLTIEAMRLFLPSTYEAVRSNPNMLTGEQPEPNHDEAALRAEYDEVFLDHLSSPRQRQIAKRALRRLFPRLEAVWSNMRYAGSDERQRSRLICSPDHFPTYFAFGVTNQGITSAESDAFIAGTSTPGETAKALRGFLAVKRKKGGTRAALALDELSVRASDIAADAIEPLVIEIFGMADQLDVPEDRDRGFYAFASNDLRIHWLLKSVMAERMDQEARSKIIRAAAPGSTIKWLVAFSDRCKSIMERSATDNDAEECLVDYNTVTWLYDLSLERLRSAANDGSLAQLAEPLLLLLRWRARAETAEVRSWTDKHLDNDAFVVAFANNAVQEKWSIGVAGLGDRIARNTEYVNLVPLKQIVDIPRLKERVAVLLASAETSLSDRMILTRFQAAPERTSRFSSEGEDGYDEREDDHPSEALDD